MIVRLYFFTIFSLWVLIYLFVSSSDSFASASLKIIDSNITKIEQKIEQSETEYDNIRFQTKLNKWNKKHEYYMNIIKSNNESSKKTK